MRREEEKCEERKGGRKREDTQCTEKGEYFAESILLHFACSHTCTHTCTHTHTHFFTSCVTHLLRNFTGSTPFTPDSSGFTPLHYAASYGHKMAVQMASHSRAATYM